MGLLFCMFEFEFDFWWESGLRVNGYIICLELGRLLEIEGILVYLCIFLYKHGNNSVVL